MTEVDPEFTRQIAVNGNEPRSAHSGRRNALKKCIRETGVTIVER